MRSAEQDRRLVGTQKQFSQTLMAVLEVFKADDPLHKILALRALRYMLRYQPPRYLQDFDEIILYRLLERYKEESPEIIKSAEKALDSLVEAVEPNKIMSILLPLMKKVWR